MHINRYDNALNIGMAVFLGAIGVWLEHMGINKVVAINAFVGAVMMLVSRLLYMSDPVGHNHLAKSYTTMLMVVTFGQLWWLLALLPLMKPWLADKINWISKIVLVLLSLAVIIFLIYYVMEHGIVLFDGNIF